VSECWELRGCDDEMRATCLHAVNEKELCPARCVYGRCNSPRSATPSDPLMLLDPDVDRTAVAKEQCLYCQRFLSEGPRLVRDSGE
jgi:hypothetical protein